VFLVVPGDVASAKMTSTQLEHRVFVPKPAVRPSTSDLRKLAELLNASDRVTLFGGAGCAGAEKQVVALAERLKAPVAYTFRGKEFLEYDNPYATGMTGLLGTESGHYSLEKADLLFLLGTDFPYDFGFIPSTIADDGDPVDVLVLMDEPTFPGCLLACPPIGIIEGESRERRNSASETTELLLLRRTTIVMRT
jgi:thiamine pyrophosphate-dependent acetolactate synthase large subunit-like protein